MPRGVRTDVRSLQQECQQPLRGPGHHRRTRSPRSVCVEPGRKNTEAASRISLARRSSKTSLRSSRRISSRSPAVVESGRRPSSASTWHYRRSVSEGTPRSRATCAIGRPDSITTLASRSSCLSRRPVQPGDCGHFFSHLRLTVAEPEVPLLAPTAQQRFGDIALARDIGDGLVALQGREHELVFCRAVNFRYLRRSDTSPPGVVRAAHARRPAGRDERLRLALRAPGSSRRQKPAKRTVYAFTGSTPLRQTQPGSRARSPRMGDDWRAALAEAQPTDTIAP